MTDRTPYVGGDTVDGCLRSAEIDRSELDHLPTVYQPGYDGQATQRIGRSVSDWMAQADRWALSEVTAPVEHYLRREPWARAVRKLVVQPRNVLVAEMGAGGREVLLAAALRIMRERGADAVEVIDGARLRQHWKDRWLAATTAGADDLIFHTPEAIARGHSRLDPDNRVVILPLLEQWRPNTKVAEAIAPVIAEAPWVIAYLHRQLVRPRALPAIYTVQPDQSLWARLDRVDLDRAYADIPTGPAA